MTSQPLFSLTGKNALITGGGSGIGKVVAHALSDAGAKIAVVGRREALLKEALGGGGKELQSQLICSQKMYRKQSMQPAPTHIPFPTSSSAQLD